MESTIFDILVWIGIIYVAVFLIEFFLGLIVLGVFVLLAMLAFSFGMVTLDQYPQLLPALLGVVGLYAVVKVVLFLVGSRDSSNEE